MENESINKSHLSYHKIGSLVRKYRKERDLKLLDLSAITGIKSAMLSKIENGRMIPTIPTLFTIIEKMGISPESFFSQLNPASDFPGYLYIPQEQFTAYEKEEGAAGFQYFSILENTFEGGTFQISLLHLGSGASRPPVTTAAFEFVYVLNGLVNYQLEDELFELKTGDALFFDGTIAHVPVNVTDHQVSLLVLYLFTSDGRQA